MNPLAMDAELFQPRGSLASEGMRNQLGRPSLDRLSVLVRESVQNAWDAKDPESEKVVFGFSGWELDPGQSELLGRTVLAQCPPSDSSSDGSLALVDYRRRLLEGERGIRVLALYDRGTSGLGGPTRADQASEDGTPRDFVDFFRNIGHPPDKSEGGGTYGYGKAALYLASHAHSILVHTRCRLDTGYESRLLGSALTDHYESGGKRFTGRHWWGERAGDGIVDPLLGRAADDLAAAIGMPGFETHESCGTTILILEPRLEGDPLGFMRSLQERTLLHFWPKMVPWPGESKPRMQFRAGWQGSELEFPAPEDHPVLSAFAKALTKVRTSELEGVTADGVAELHCLKPKKLLGRLGLQRFSVEPNRWGLDPDVARESGLTLDDLANRVALLRRPELIVEYVEGRRFPTEAIAYAGVFLADKSMDRVYAEAEPPTHDTWAPDLLEDRASRSFVRVTYKRIAEEVDQLVVPTGGGGEAVAGPTLASLANRMGSVLYGVTGLSGKLRRCPETERAASSGNAKKRKAKRYPKWRPRVQFDFEPELVRLEWGMVAIHQVEVPEAAQSPFRVHLETSIALLGGGAESSPPVESAVPSIVFVENPSGQREHGQPDSFEVGVGVSGIWKVGVHLPDDACVDFDARARKVEIE